MPSSRPFIPAPVICKISRVLSITRIDARDKSCTICAAFHCCRVDSSRVADRHVRNGFLLLADVCFILHCRRRLIRSDAMSTRQRFASLIRDRHLIERRNCVLADLDWGGRQIGTEKDRISYF